jgi:signal transduction histidine kinase
MDTYSTTPKAQETISALWRLEKIILNTLDFKDVVQKIVESTLSELGYLNLGYRVIVLALIDPHTQTLKRISFSRTKEGIEAIGSLSLPFEQINIPLSEEDNLCIKAINQQKPFFTHNVADVFYPTLKAEEILPIQARVGIKTTMVYPVLSKGEPLGVLIFSMIKTEQEVSQEEKDLIAGFTDVVGLAVQNSHLYTSLQEANEKLKSLDRLKDEFVSLASHELRTPMTAIKSYSWMLREEKQGQLNDKQKEYANIIYISTERLIRLVNDMLNVSRIEAGRLTINPKPVDLAKLAQDVLSEVLPSAQSQQIVIILQTPSSPLGTVLADADKTKEVLINLIGNSLKFTPQGGTITISFEQKDDTIITRVTDTGKGIKAEDMSKLFKKFGMIEGNYTVKNIGQGTGLGLYISKSIVELQGGKMTVFSEGENKGTTFTFSLKKVKNTPMQQEKQDDVPDASASTPAPFPAPPQA